MIFYLEQSHPRTRSFQEMGALSLVHRATYVSSEIESRTSESKGGSETSVDVVRV